jgi:hypothetical protein
MRLSPRAALAPFPSRPLDTRSFHPVIGRSPHPEPGRGGPKPGPALLPRLRPQDPRHPAVTRLQSRGLLTEPVRGTGVLNSWQSLAILF